MTAKTTKPAETTRTTKTATPAIPSLACNDQRRRRQVRHQGCNGIDAIEVSDDQRVLTVTFLGKAPEGLTPANARIDGGQRVTGIRIVDVRRCIEDDPELDDRLDVTVDRPGDFSVYTLRLVEADEHGRPGIQALGGFDPRYAQLDFSFKAGCPSDLDCAAVDDCPPPALVEPDISYLAKDYSSFRQLILDRLALVMPAWTERHIPDLGITLVELLAYVGDYLSYYQDAVATEAYLDTARKRISVRRHVRLIDYPMHDGCNARAWVCIEVNQPLALKQPQFFFVTGHNGALPGPALAAEDLLGVPRTAYEVFEPLADVELNPAHNAIPFWTWGNQECCLNRGATRTTLKDDHHRRLDLHPGDVLIFEEVLGPRTGAAADADPTHRQAVRLTTVEAGRDELYDQPIVEIEWPPEDALTFPLCLSAVAEPPDCKLVYPSVACGNVVLVDHGRSLAACGEDPEPLEEVPTSTPQPGGCAGVGDPRDPVLVQPPFDLHLRERPVTQRVPFPSPGTVSARQAMRLGRIPGQARARLHELWQRAHGGQALDEDQVEEIRTIFGPRALAEARFPIPKPRARRQPTAAEQASALGRLLANEPRLLAKKVRWLEDLARRARAGLELGPDELCEIHMAWGDRYAEGLEAADAAFSGPARDALRHDPRDALPVIRLRADPQEADWTARRGLLASGAKDRHFVAELDNDGVTCLRFGDGELGRAPRPGTRFLADYRIGNGTAGNVGAETIRRIVFCTNDPGAVKLVRNPLPAEGGTEPQPLAEVKLFAPGAFRHQLQRAVTADDYAALAGQLPGLQRAAASLRWNGSWYEAEIAVDPLGGKDADDALLERVREGVFRYRRIGHDLVVEPARSVPLLLGLSVCVLPHHLRAHVNAALLDAFSNRPLRGGRRGFFHPDSLTFGDDIDVSRLVALAQSIPGVESVEVTTLQRLFEGDHGELTQGFLALGPLEIARLDNDPAFPENGQLQLKIGGGR
ncbi:MAG: putative baseplate assembly protein [Egibacteraceae bacterium]